MSDAKPGDRRWLLLTVQAPPRGQEPMLVDALRRLGAHAVEREGDRFVALLPPPADLPRLLRDAEMVVRASTHLPRPLFSWRWGGEEALADRWRRDASPRRITDRIVVSPEGREPGLRSGDLVLRLDPGVGFGTAEHPTSRLCLRLLDVLVNPGDRVADVGAGSGILAIAAALLGADRALALEADPLACATARSNASASGVDDRVEVRNLFVGPGTLAGLGPFDGIVANLEMPILIPLLEDFRGAVVSAGWIVVSGVSRAEHPEVLRATAAAGLSLHDEEVEQGWWAGVLRRG